jgi:hypothetical protein
MTDDRKGEVGGRPPEVERELGRLRVAPVPEGMRQRVLDRAGQAQRDAVLTPGFRRLAVACSLLIIAALAIDPLMARDESARWIALLDGRPLVTRAEGTAPELADALSGNEKDTDRLQALAISAARASRPTNLMEALERLKGWLNDETSEDPD